MSKKAAFFLLGVLAGVVVTMLYVHRDAISASLTDGIIPDAPDGCPCSKKNCL